MCEAYVSYKSRISFGEAGLRPRLDQVNLRDFVSI
jgi:hypothetical protein